MFYLKKTIEVSASHKLNLPYKSPCNNLHGHNYKITVYCKSETLDPNGMVIDFSEIKNIINTRMDHKNMNDVFDFTPTAECLAQWIRTVIPFCYKVTIQESKGNEITYEI